MEHGNIQSETVESKRMSDLISRSEAVQRLIRETVDSKNSLIHINTIKRLLQDVESSYDIDKVVKELKELKMRYFLTIANTGDEKSDFAYENVGNALDGAIEIVKQGGIVTETETIRDKAVKWNNNSSKRVPYEFIDYVEGKREISVSDNVCEWKQDEDGYTNCRYSYDEIDSIDFFKYCPYCGKKIKVVE